MSQVRLHLSTVVRELHWFDQNADVDPHDDIVEIFTLKASLSPNAVDMTFVVDCGVPVQMKWDVSVAFIDLDDDAGVRLEFPTVCQTFTDVLRNSCWPVFIREMVDINAMVKTTTLICATRLKHDTFKTAMTSGFRLLDDCIRSFLANFDVVQSRTVVL